MEPLATSDRMGVRILVVAQDPCREREEDPSSSEQIGVFISCTGTTGQNRRAAQQRGPSCAVDDRQEVGRPAKARESKFLVRD